MSTSRKSLEVFLCNPWVANHRAHNPGLTLSAKTVPSADRAYIAISDLSESNRLHFAVNACRYSPELDDCNNTTCHCPPDRPRWQAASSCMRYHLVSLQHKTLVERHSSLGGFGLARSILARQR